MSHIPIRVNTLRANQKLHFDVYVYLDEHYVHYKRADAVLEGQELEQMRKKKLKKLFIPGDQEDRYLSYLDSGLSDATTNTTPLEERGKIVQDTVITMAENAERHFESEKGFKSTEERFSKVVEFLASDKGALKSILGNTTIKQDEHQHAATVASLCLAMAHRMGITDNNEKLELSLAALVHDIGKTKVNADISKPFASMSQAEQAQYKRHCQIGLDILSGKPFITPAILGMVASHEEKAFGRGYPENKNLNELPIRYQILSICNAFDHFCTERAVNHAQGMDPFFEAHEKDYSSDLMMSLSAVLV